MVAQQIFTTVRNTFIATPNVVKIATPNVVQVNEELPLHCDKPKQININSSLSNIQSILDIDFDGKGDVEEQSITLEDDDQVPDLVLALQNVQASAISKPMISLQKPLSVRALVVHKEAPKKSHSCDIRLNIFQGMFNLLRTIVSKNRQRLIKDEFDLDLSYITRQIIAMSIPGINPMLALVRNPYSEVKEYLDRYHYKHYKVYNLCVEYPYDGNDLFDSNYAYFPVEDFQPIGLDQMYAFCADASEWLRRDPKNVIVVHCKAGKGRTGCIICALLCYLGITEQGEYEEFGDPESAIQHFAAQRTLNNEGISRASQKNYVRAYGRILNDLKFGVFLVSHPIRVEKIVVSGLRQECRKSKLAVKVYFRPRGEALSQKIVDQEFHHRDNPSYDEQLEQQNKDYLYYVTQDENCLVLDFRSLSDTLNSQQWEIDGDLKVLVSRLGPMSKRLFYVWFSTMALFHENFQQVGYQDLDKPYPYIRADPEKVSVKLFYKKIDTKEEENTLSQSALLVSNEVNKSLFQESPFLQKTPSLLTVMNSIQESVNSAQIIDNEESVWDTELSIIDHNRKRKQNRVILKDMKESRSLQRCLTASSKVLSFEQSLSGDDSDEIPEINQGIFNQSLQFIPPFQNGFEGKGQRVFRRSQSEENLQDLQQREILESSQKPSFMRLYSQRQIEISDNILKMESWKSQ